MQKTSELWQTLWETPNTKKEYRFDINGVSYGADAEVSHHVDWGLYQDFGFGNAASATLDLEVFADDIPRGAKIERFIRLVNGDQVSEWLPSGVYFVNRRAEDDGLWKIQAFDVMRKAEVVWVPDDSLEFPMLMQDAVNEFARIMGCEVDERTQLAPLTIDYPAEYTIREILCYIAAAHIGNWIVTGEGKLLLVPLGSEPKETYYLVTERGRAITLGGTRILVG